MLNRFVQLVITVVIALTLTACSGEGEIDTSTGAVSCFNIAEPAALALDSFTVTETLQYAVADDILKGMQPNADNANEVAAGIVQFLEDRLRENTGFEGEPEAVTSYTNNLDIMEQILAENKIQNITAGREMVKGCKETGSPIRYNNANIEVTKVDESGETVDTLNYLVDYNYSEPPQLIDEDPTTEERNPIFTRTIMEFTGVSRDPNSNPDESTDVVGGSVISLASYDPDQFQAMDYIQPTSMFAAWSADSEEATVHEKDDDRDNNGNLIYEDCIGKYDGKKESLTLYKDFNTLFEDTIEYANSDGIDSLPGLDKVGRIKLTIDYLTGEIEIFTSSYVSAITGPTGEFLADVSDKELCHLFVENTQWNAEVMTDSNYELVVSKDPEAPILPPVPIATYTGTIVPHRQ